MIGRVLFRAVMLAVSVVLGASVAAPAVASTAVDIEGRQTGTTSADGSYAQLVGNGFSATNGQCVLYSALSSTVALTGPQIEAGIVRCNNAPGGGLDSGACTDGHAFVERFDGANYFCNQGYTFTNNTAYDATTYRTGSTSTTFHGHVNGADLDQNGFGTSAATIGYAWAEATGISSSCPSPSKGTFNIWKRYDTATGWHIVTNSSIHREHIGIPGAPCWPTVSGTNANGGFYVD